MITKPELFISLWLKTSVTIASILTTVYTFVPCKEYLRTKASQIDRVEEMIEEANNAPESHKDRDVEDDEWEVFLYSTFTTTL